ncbi:MAG TPA: MFS transporter [Bryobacteraceae bacterium]|nr:MFS transporter [Bryobacteraceae bacterium]
MGYLALLRFNRNFRLLWTAQVISEIGDWFYTVAIYSLLLEYTGSAKSIALAFTLQVLPQFLASPTAGVVNDRLSRRRVMIFADWARALVVGCMLLVRGPEMVWALYALLFLETIMWALFEPGRTATIPNITAGRDVITGNALSSITWSFNFAVGSAVGGVIAAFFGRQTVFFINAISFIVSGLLIQRMRFEEPHLKDLPPFRLRDLFDFKPIAEGFRYVKADARLAATMFVKAGLGLIGTNWVILPILGREAFPVQMSGLTGDQSATLGMSLLLGARGVGAICGPLIAGYLVRHDEARMRPAIAVGFVLSAVGYLLLSLTGDPWLAALCVAIAHAGSSITWVFSTTLLQLNTEDRYRGRVTSVEFGFSVLMMSIMSTAAGTLIDQGMSPFGLAAVTGAVMLIPAIAWTFALRLWRHQ